MFQWSCILISLINPKCIVYNHLHEVIAMDDPHPIHVDGHAGRGKTYVLYPVIGALRKANEIVLLSASSAYAAKNYPGGQTLHFLYGIPVDEHNPFLISMVHPKSDHAKLLLAARCHIIDEISALHFKAFDCADQLMRSLLRDVIEFGVAICLSLLAIFTR